MSGRVFLDTNVVVYAFTEGDPRQARALEVLKSGGQISVQVLNEFVNVARRKLGMRWSSIRDGLFQIRNLCGEPLSVSLALHEHALEIAERHQLRIYDGLIIAAGLWLNCSILWSEDLQNGQVFDGRLTVRNPFLGH